MPKSARRNDYDVDGVWIPMDHETRTLLVALARIEGENPLKLASELLRDSVERRGHDLPASNALH